MSLVAALMLILAALRAAHMATPFSGGSTLGGISFWDLRGALPLGVFMAGALLLISAAAAQCAQAALHLAGWHQRLALSLGSIASAGLWCGVPCLACCYNSLPHIFAWLSDYYETSPWQTAP